MMRKKLPADPAVAARKSREKPAWRATAAALATAALFGVASFDANALGLGRITVQSALGEPLRAEVDVVEITPEELASLRTSVASPEAFRAAGMDYSPVLANLEVTLKNRPDGRPFLLLTSQRPVNDPFIDLILETQWASGRIVRDYTMLFDPPQLRQNAAPATAQVVPVTPAAPRAQPSPVAPKTTTGRSAPAIAPSARAQGLAAGGTTDSSSGTVTVQKGDSAGKIAAAHKPASVSLDQMLLALLQANPDAFSGGNVNRLKAGAVLQIPSAEQAEQAPAGEAARTIIAQSRDFNEFRRRLAEGAPTAAVPGSERQASGKVQAQVQEKSTTAPNADKLTLSKGTVQGKAADQIARQREAQDTTARVAELNKNIADLNRLSSATAAPSPATAAASKPATRAAAGTPAGTASATAPTPVAAPTIAAAAPAAAASAPAATAAVAAASSAVGVQAAPAASAPAATATANVPGVTASASAPAAPGVSGSASGPAPAVKPPVAVKPKPAAPPPEEPGLFDDLLDNPLLLAGGGLVVALLAALGVWRVRQRKKSPQVDSSFLESRLQPDSFFGASGGQRIDTNEGGATGSSMVYSPSQLDAAGDVDPVAEADVYLAYGRDLQAEEILKEALRISPQRVAIHAKLLEIYAKRRDAKAFEVSATEAYSLTHGEGPEWEHICDLGRELDSANPLYRPGGQPSGVAALEGAAAAGAKASEPEAPLTTSPDVDLDLDFSLGDDSADQSQVQTQTQGTAPVHLHTPPEPLPGLDLEFEAAAANAAHDETPSAGAKGPAEPTAVMDAPLSFELPDVAEPPAAAVAAPAVQASADDNALNFDLDAQPDVALATEPAPMAHAAAAAPADAKMIEFDLGELSLDLDASGAARPAAKAAVQQAASANGLDLPLGADESSGDPLATKFALAQEFNAIGDPDGARSLAQEVLAEASGDLKSRAQRFLAEIG